MHYNLYRIVFSDNSQCDREWDLLLKLKTKQYGTLGYEN